MKIVLNARLGGKRGAGVPGYGVRGPGVWKTRGLSAKHSRTIISLKNKV